MLGGAKCLTGLTKLARPTIGFSARFAQESVKLSVAYISVPIFESCFWPVNFGLRILHFVFDLEKDSFGKSI